MNIEQVEDNDLNVTFKEKVVRKAAGASKKHKVLTPLIYFVAFVVLGVYSLNQYFFKNGKRYISILLALVFFFMSSSFGFPDKSGDNEIYLNAKDDSAKITEEINTEVAEIESKTDKTEEWIEDSDLIDQVDQSDLTSTDNIDTFTLDDFLNDSDIESGNGKEAESSFDKNAWNLILVNKTHPVPDDYEFELTTITGSMKCDKRVLEPLTDMLSAAKNDGVDLLVCSPYRDYALQTRLFERKINLYMSKGYSYLEAYKLSSQKVTVPGASEHQLGMAFDIVTSSHSTLDYEFGDTKAGKWLKEHSKEYGFILRYPRGKEDITSIEYEPWHFRYVGIEAATYIMDNEITLEEFIEGL
ncbi:MAG: M15 family metallopeptidase [Lachnospiraceae bacterium]|nr:M15 family metallopeptidase [Lachnospiraceae bacterium]